MLKDEIEKLIRNGYLWDYVRDGRTNPRDTKMRQNLLAKS